jgi:N-acetylglutamate synthase/N-acetylornithine aminotransferase
MDQVAAHCGCPREQVFVSSTGVIGVPLPKDKARAGIEAAPRPALHLGRSREHHRHDRHLRQGRHRQAVSAKPRSR